MGIFVDITKKLLHTINPNYEQDIHLKDSVSRISKYYEEILQFAIHKKDNPNLTDTDLILSLLKITSFENDESEDVIINNIDKALLTGPIKVYSVCAHHFAPIIGNVWISYTPKDKILGLSKLSRIAKLYARQPIVQELYTQGLYNILKDITHSENINVITYMRHLCMESRGVNDTNSVTLFYICDDSNIFNKIKLEKP